MTSRTVQPPVATIDLETPLWHFSASLWRNVQTVTAALKLQSAGWVVSHLLVAAYLAREGYLWDGQEPAEIANWRRDVTQSLRALRSALPKERPDLSALREHVAQAELEAERVELGWWSRWIEAHPLPKTPAQSPLRLLAENMIAAGDTISLDTLPLLEAFAQPLLPADSRESFALELQAALDDADPQQ